MGCLILLTSMISPRLALVLVWIFTNFVDRAYDSFIVPFLGLLVLPWTTLIYSLAYAPRVGVTGWGWFFVILGVLADLSSYGENARRNRERVPGWNQTY
jgi:hypothetical protein